MKNCWCSFVDVLLSAITPRASFPYVSHALTGITCTSTVYGYMHQELKRLLIVCIEPASFTPCLACITPQTAWDQCPVSTGQRQSVYHLRIRASFGYWRVVLYFRAGWFWARATGSFFRGWVRRRRQTHPPPPQTQHHPPNVQNWLCPASSFICYDNIIFLLYIYKIVLLVKY